ncbi:MAG: NAD(P)/FAD-dependent oxidoreductase [Bdellovibrionales bacterium]|nr:NAD(P)/FAD-dependent oxidoreductase [Bdellovibrionales bacterium]
MNQADFDLCVIGAGPAGFAAAMRAWDFGKRVCLIERSLIGGAGLHHGALSSKTLWELSRDYLNAVRTDRGYHAENVQLEYRTVIDTVSRAVGEKVDQMRRQLIELEHPRTGFPGSITLLHGQARFVDSHRVHIEAAEAGQAREISAERFIIATGSRPRSLPEIEVNGTTILTSDHISRLESFPKSMVILGAGVIGCEFATIFANYGQTKVYLIDRADRILPFEDEDIARICAKNLEAKGVTIHHRAALKELRSVDGGVQYTIEHPTGGQETITTSHALISVGRVPNTEDLGLAAAGVEVSKGGHIVTNAGTSSVDHIYAVGDVTLDIALVSIGEIEGRYVVEQMYGVPGRQLRYDNVSTIMFLDPEVAAIGLNEQEAQAQKIPYRVATYGLGLVNRAIAMRATDGFVKLLVTDEEPHLMLGMRALGVHASTMIEAASLVIQLQRPAADLGELMHPHPAVTEALQECVRMLSGTSIYKPHVFKSDLRCSRIGYAGST